MHPGIKKFGAGVLMMAGAVVGGTGMEAVRAGEALAPVQAAAATAAVETAADTTPDQLSRAFRRAAERAQPAVVHVQVEVTRTARAEVPEPFEGTPWEDMFRQGRPQQPQPRQGSGSGFIISEDGYILTNNHVIDGAERVTVVLKDRREFTARVVGRDPNTDVAVIKVEAAGLPTVRFGDSDPLGVGDWVVALGYPLQLGSTATAGIVSAKGKNIGIIGRGDGATAPLEHFIQTDAAINPGNSGGPLVDLQGRVVGINSAIASPTGYYSGYGFAIPINLARRVAEDLIEHGAVRRPKIGVGIATVDPADAEVYGLERTSGVEITMVERGGAGEAAGLRIGDVVVAVDGERVDDSGEFMERIARRQPGETVALEVVRYGERLRVPVKLEVFEPAVKLARAEAPARERGLDRLGFEAADLTPALARRMDLEATDGVVITALAPSGPAAGAGLAPGMLVESLNGRDVSSVADLEKAARELGDAKVASVIVRLPDGTRTIVNYRLRG